MASCLSSTVHLNTTQHQPVPSLENLKRFGHKAPPVEVPTEPKNDRNAQCVLNIAPIKKIPKEKVPLKLKKNNGTSLSAKQ